MTLVQDPREALFDGMIRSAQRSVKIDGTFRTAQLGASLTALACSRTTAHDEMTTDEPAIEHGSSPDDDRSATRYTCPDCGGALWEHGDEEAHDYRCSVGHAYSLVSLDAEQGRDVESALWAAARLLGDRKTLLEDMARTATARGHDRSAQTFLAQAGEVASAASTIRSLIEGGRLPLGSAADQVARG